MNPPELDLHGILSGTGQRFGISRDQLWSAYSEIQRVESALREAVDANLLPHLRPPAPKDVLSIGAPWRGRPLVVLGEPIAANGAAALASAAAPGWVTVIDSVDAGLTSAALDTPEAVLVILDGPAWVRLMARAMTPRAAIAVVFAGDGTQRPGWAPPGATLVGHSGASDLRFSGVGFAALTLLAAVDGDVASCCAAIRDSATRCMEAGLYDNPAYLLAATARAVELHTELNAPNWLLPSARLRRWGRWLSGAWGAMAARPEQMGEIRQPRGARASYALLGDEGAIQASVEGVNDRWTLALRDRRPLDDLRLGDQMTAWRLSRDMLEAHRRVIQTAGRGYAELRIEHLDAAGLAAAAVIWLQAATVLGALRNADPLTMDAADRWRIVFEEDILPEDVLLGGRFSSSGSSADARSSEEISSEDV